jgi:mercuric reductase
VVMIERGTVKGTCVNTGCVPSKALLAAAEARHVALAQRFPGIATSAGAVDTATLHTATDQLVRRMRADKYVGLAAGGRGRGSAVVGSLGADLVDVAGGVVVGEERAA